LNESPPWKPANAGDENKPVKDFVEISVQINNGVVETRVLDQGKAKFYNLTH
jgi:hypothetical protein